MTLNTNNPAAYNMNTEIMKSAVRLSFADAVCSCPRCNLHAFEGEVDALFGIRRMKRGLKADGSFSRIEIRVQSHCRECRKEERQAKAAMRKAA